MSDWKLIADQLAKPLRHMPCKCKVVGSWPIFEAPEKANECARCAALAEYELAVARASIVQEPK